MNVFTLIRETLGPAERRALRRGAAVGAVAFALVAGFYLAAGLGPVAVLIDGAIFAWLLGTAGLLTGPHR